jgi:DnaJ-class molecular chaperone
MAKNELAQETPFKNTQIVTCGVCRGEKTITLFDKKNDCTMCEGSGILKRVTEGTVKLYVVDKNLAELLR